MNRNLLPALAIAALVGASHACSADNDRQETVQALGESILLTATAAAEAGFNAQANVQTAEAEATARSEAAAATQAAQSPLNDEAQAATATAVAPILAELPLYGIDPSEGRPGWVHPPERMEVEGFLQYDYANRFIGTIGQDFVVSADITWNTFTGLSGCGFVLRSDGNEDALNQYLAIATRGGNGRVIFSTMVDGDVKRGMDLYAYGLDPKFEWRNDTTNRLTVVARGNTFNIYTNGTWIGEFIAGEAQPPIYIPEPPPEPPAGAPAAILDVYEEELSEYSETVTEIRANYQARVASYREDVPFFERGFIAMVALSESGRTICQFDNAWLWLLDA